MDSDDLSLNQAEHEHISTALEVEQLEVNLFRSKSLWVPIHGRGVFGGQVISQALVSATNCVDPAFGLHSLHCYFLTSASPSTPIIYFVERLRHGRSYVTCSVKAVQKGSLIFILMCSFQKPEPWQPSHQWTMPEAPDPEDCELIEDRILKTSQDQQLPAAARNELKVSAKEKARSPIAVRPAKENEVQPDGSMRFMYWMRAKNVPAHEPQFQKCILSYLSDLRLIGTASRTLGLTPAGKDAKGYGMLSTIDHSIAFYNDRFNCGDWLLYVMVSPRTGSGRGIVHGQIYSRNGELVAITTQEGVVRASIRGPTEETGETKARL